MLCDSDAESEDERGESPSSQLEFSLPGGAQIFTRIPIVEEYQHWSEEDVKIRLTDFDIDMELHPLILLFQKLISRGVLPDDCFLMVYLSSLFAILDWFTRSDEEVKQEPAQNMCPAWPDEVCDVAMSLNNIGGRAAYNFIDGGGNIGLGKNSGMDMKNHIFPLPSWSRLQARLPEWTLEQGVYVDLQRSNLEIASDGARDIACWTDLDLCIIFACLGGDGMAIKPEVAYEHTKQRFGGAKGDPITAQDVAAGVDMVELAPLVYTEAGVTVVSTIDGKLAFVAELKGC